MSEKFKAHHRLDPYPIPKDKTPLFINEPWVIDRSLLEMEQVIETDDAEDNIRVYFPMDINSSSILRRLDSIIERYGAASEENEMNYSVDVGMILAQLEIYDQIWYVRHMPEKGNHSKEAIELAEKIIERLEEIPDDCAESFPFEEIEELRREYGGGNRYRDGYS